MKDVIIKELKKIDWQQLKVYQKPILAGLIGAGLIASYFIYKDYFPSTDNAYVNANIINMIPKVNGYITHIYVQNNQHVKKGDLLLVIDQKDYQLLLNQAKLDFKLAKKAAISADSDIQQANANIIKAKANYEYTQQMRNRYTALYRQNAGSQEAQQKFENDFKQAQQVLQQAQTAFHQAKIQLAATLEKVELAKTQLENAQNTFNSTLIKAPVTGYVSNLNLQVGQLVGKDRIYLA